MVYDNNYFLPRHYFKSFIFIILKSFKFHSKHNIFLQYYIAANKLRPKFPFLYKLRNDNIQQLH